MQGTGGIMDWVVTLENVFEPRFDTGMEAEKVRFALHAVDWLCL